MVIKASEALTKLWMVLNEHGKHLDNPNLKLSHEKKELARHVDECWDFAEKLFDKVFSHHENHETLKNFCFSLCVTHDIGKLRPEWKVGGEKQKHAYPGVRLLQGIDLNNILPVPAGFESVLLFSILKHHSSLNLREDEIKFYTKLGKILEENEIAIGLADTIGIFKLADILSAGDVSDEAKSRVLMQYEWPVSANQRIEEIVRDKARTKTGSFDFKKFEKQTQIAHSDRKHLILVAPTGWGKTAVALLRAQYLKPKKIFYILPTITAIKEFEEDLRTGFGEDYVGEYFYFSDVEYLTRRRFEEREEIFPVDLYRYFAPKFVITTVDQILLTFLQFGRYHLRRFNFRNSLLIFDEFHLLTPQMMSALGTILDVFTKIYDFSTLFISATPHLRILHESVLKNHDYQHVVLEQEYANLKRHIIEFRDEPLLDFVKDKINDFRDKRILIITNQVDTAIQVFDFINSSSTNLIHSRFSYKDRTDREKEIKSSKILVSTQVAEVSLDISFDILITELAPLPSLIQRFGRVNRYQKQAEGTNVYICDISNPRPYSRCEIDLTRKILSDAEEKLTTEGEKIYLQLVDNYYLDLLPTVEHKTLFLESLKRSKFFYSVLYSEGEEIDFERILGREPSCLAVPYCYENEVYELKKKIKEEELYEKKRDAIAEMKKFFMPVPLFIIHEEGTWNEELGCYVVGGQKYIYTTKKGLVRREDGC